MQRKMKKFLNYLIILATVFWCMGLPINPVHAASPSAPSNLTATLVADPLAVDLAWQSDGSQTYFRIERAIDNTDGNNDNFETLATNLTPNTYRDTMVWRGRDYYYRVIACSIECSVASNIVSISIPSLDNTNLGLIKNIPSLSTPNAVKIIGNYAYVIDGGLKIIDISDSTKPLIKSSLPLKFNSSSGFDADENYAYIGIDQVYLVVVSISDIMHPYIVSEWRMPNLFYSLSLSGDKLYMDNSTNGMQIIDVSNPSDLKIISTIDTPGSVKWVKVVGNYAYLNDDDLGAGNISTFRIADISNPYSPQLLPGSVEMANEIIDFDIAGNYAYVTVGYAGTKVIDITDPSAPSLVTTVPPLSNSMSRFIKISGNYAYITTMYTNKVLQILDITEGRNPVQLGSGSINASGGNTNGIDISGNILIISGGGQSVGLTIANITDPANISISNQIGNSGAQVASKNAYPYFYSLDRYNLNESLSGLSVYNVADPNLPYQVGKLPLTSPRGFEQLGNYLYITTNDFLLSVVDVTNPVNPTLVKTVNIYNYGYDVKISGDYVFVAGNSGMSVVNITNRTAPVYKKRLAMQPGSSALKIAISGSKAYIAATKTMQIVDIQTPLSPHLDGFISLTPEDPANDIVDVAVSGNYAYFACGGLGIKIVNVQNPHAPNIVFTVPSLPGTIENVKSVAISNGFLFSYHHSIKDILQVTNINNPLAPVSVSTEQIAAYPPAINISERYVYAGLSIFDLYYDRLKIENEASCVTDPFCGSISRGQEITYALKVTNLTPYTLTGLNFSDQIPAGTTYVDGGQLVGDKVTWSNLGSIAPNANIEVSFKVTVD